MINVCHNIYQNVVLSTITFCYHLTGQNKIIIWVSNDRFTDWTQITEIRKRNVLTHMKLKFLLQTLHWNWGLWLCSCRLLSLSYLKLFEQWRHFSIVSLSGIVNWRAYSFSSPRILIFTQARFHAIITVPFSKQRMHLVFN